MPLNTSVILNHLKTSSKPYYLRSSCSGTVDQDELIDIMARGRTTLTKPDIAGVLVLFEEELDKLLAEGKFVKTRFGSFYLCASGTLDEESQPFSPGSDGSDHAIRVHYRANRDFEAQLAARTSTKRIREGLPHAPCIKSFKAVETKAEGSVAAGDFLTISGLRLKLDPEDPRQGVFLVNGAEHRVMVYAQIEPSRLVCKVPGDLNPGQYQLLARSLGGKDKILQGSLDGFVAVL